ADALGRFSREAANASRINHPNVATVYDFGEADGHVLYLAMEFVEGHTLSALVQDGRPLPVDRAVRIAMQIADALIAAHDVDVVHRDLKPDNIMLARNRAGEDVVKVVDFGIAKAITATGQTVTGPGIAIGTPAYMSPEQLLAEPVDARSD